MIRGMNNFVGADEDEEGDSKSGVSINTGARVSRKSPLGRPRSPFKDSDRESFTYEHFPVVCPTCRGSGKVLEDDVNTLVSFVPVKDERLKPSRIFYKILLMLIVCACIAVPLGFFLIPRSVTLELLKITSKNISIPDNTTLTPYIIVQTGVKIMNQNYLAIRIKDVRLQASWNKIILNTDTCQALSETVPSRSTKEYAIEVKMIFKGSSGRRLRDECAYGWKTHIPQKFVATATISFLNQISHISVTKYPYVQCYDFGRLNRR